jgi:hypothetical protein
MLGSVNDLYTRFQIARPDYLGDDHWACIEREADRLWRSLVAGDGSQALSDIKCLVESISRIVLEIDGTPAAPNTAFDTVVTQAHTLLTGQPGHELANQSTFGQLATQASKIARNLGNIRNESGGDCRDGGMTQIDERTGHSVEQQMVDGEVRGEQEPTRPPPRCWSGAARTCSSRRRTLVRRMRNISARFIFGGVVRPLEPARRST